MDPIIPQLVTFTNYNDEADQFIPCLRAGLDALFILKTREFSVESFQAQHKYLQKKFSKLVDKGELHAGKERAELVHEVARVVLAFGSKIPSPGKGEPPLNKQEIARILECCNGYIIPSEGYSEAMIAYTHSFRDKPKFTDRIKDLGLTEDEEEKYFKEFEDPNSFEVANIPVLVNGKSYDLAAIFIYCRVEEGVFIELDSEYKFGLNQIQPNIATRDKLETLITKLEKELPFALARKLDIAVSDKDLPTVQKLIAANKELVYTPSPLNDKLLPIINAVLHSSDEVVEALWKVPGIDLTVTHQGMNLLMLAAHSGKESVVRLLLRSEKFPINAQTAEGKTALILAVEAKHPSVTKCLIEKGADIGTTIMDVEKAADLSFLSEIKKAMKLCLFDRINMGDLPFIEEYIRLFQADPEAFYCYREELDCPKRPFQEVQYHAILLAVLSGKSEIAITLCNKLKVISDDSRLIIHGFTPLHQAARIGDVPLLQALLKRSEIDVNAADNFGATPCMNAITHGHFEATKFLINYEKTDPLKKNLKGKNALQYLAKKIEQEGLNSKWGEILKEKAAQEGPDSYWDKTMKLLERKTIFGFFN
jgi:ankyrin repeat protein